jgi:bilirubin oxidase
MALASIVEGKPEDIMTVFKDWQSPEYPLIFRQALPIPPVKQPKQ